MYSHSICSKLIELVSIHDLITVTYPPLAILWCYGSKCLQHKRLHVTVLERIFLVFNTALFTLDLDWIEVRGVREAENAQGLLHPQPYFLLSLICGGLNNYP